MLCLVMGACKEDWEVGGPDGDSLRLYAQKEKAISRVGSENAFDEGTRFRIWADPFPEEGVLGRESLLGTGIHYIALEDKKCNAELSKEIDFYGFTNNDDSEDILTPSFKHVYNIELSEERREYTDYMRAELSYSERVDNSNILTLKFRHIMSKVIFKVVEQSDTDIPKGGQLKVTSITLGKENEKEGIPSKGIYDVVKGVFTVSEYNKRLLESDLFVPVATSMKEVDAATVGSLLIFPSQAENQADNPTVPLYYVRVTFEDPQERYGGIKDVCIPIYDSWKQGKEPLDFQSNYQYTLVINFLSDGDKRVITLVPEVYDWLEGEGTEDVPYEEQDFGQPVTFNGVMWSDRNLGATSAHPTRSYDDWLKSVGYFYQYGRNFPYFPMPESSPHLTKEKYILANLGDPDLLRQSLVTGGEENGKNPLYPVIDPASWNLTGDEPNYYYKVASSTSDNECIWNLGDLGCGHTFCFSYDENYSLEKLETQSLGRTPRTWEDQSETPCPPGWRLPTEEDFRGILPGSAYSGNITFRKYNRINNVGSFLAEIGSDEKTKKKIEPNFESIFNKENIGKIEVIKGTGTPDEGKTAYNGEFPYIFREEKEEFGGKPERCVYILSMGDGDWVRVRDKSGDLKKDNINYVYNWGVIYGIKRQGTDKAYRIKWEIELVSEDSNPKKEEDVINYTEPFRGVLVISRYEADRNTDFKPDAEGRYRECLRKFDWKNPSEVLYLPVGGIANNWSYGKIANVGTETWYATNEMTPEGKKAIMWFKFAGTETSSQSIIFSKLSLLGDAVQIRCVRDLDFDKR